MKTKIIILFIAIVSATNVFSQKQGDKSLYTICGKSGNCSMTLDEFKKCTKELTSVDKDLKITSFKISILVAPLTGKDSVYVDYSNTGNAFSKATSDSIDKLISEKRVSKNKIMIEEVKGTQGGKEAKIPGMVIQLK